MRHNASSPGLGPVSSGPGDATPVRPGARGAMGVVPDAPRPTRRGRCAGTWVLDPGNYLSTVRLAVCDRLQDHPNRHRGRLWRLDAPNAKATLLAWVEW